MLLYLNSKENIAYAREVLVSLGVEHHLVTTSEEPIFEIQSELSIYPPKILALKLKEFGRVEHNGAKTPILDEIQNHEVKISCNQIAVTFKNGGTPVWIAGPCSLDEEENLRKTAKFLSSHGIHILRGGAVKPRTSPHEFQGVGRSGYQLLAQIAHEEGLLALSEALSEDDIEEACKYLDMIQVGARNMQNFPLLKKLGKSGKPILLKRGPGATLREWASAAEYIFAEGNQNVVLCERGVRGLERELRYTLDLAGAYFMSKRYGLPVVIDPSHGTGVKELIAPCVKAALAMSFSGVMIEVHPNPAKAKSDALQTLSFSDFINLKKS